MFPSPWKAMRSCAAWLVHILHLFRAPDSVLVASTPDRAPVYLGSIPLLNPSQNLAVSVSFLPFFGLLLFTERALHFEAVPSLQFPSRSRSRITRQPVGQSVTQDEVAILILPLSGGRDSCYESLVSRPSRNTRRSHATM